MGNYDFSSEIGKTYGCYKILSFTNDLPYAKRKCLVECINCGLIDVKSFKYIRNDKKEHCRNCFPKLKEYEDLVGQRYGRLTILKRNGVHVQKNGSKKVVVQCECDCGNIVDVQLCKLKNGHTTSCGCYHKEKIKEVEDLTGRKYGKLTVIKRLEADNGRTTWECLCDCGNTTTATTTALNLGLKKSCGCINSCLEYEFARYLNENNIEFKQQYRISECKFKRALPFDFAIFVNESLVCLVELNGQQHYSPYTFCGETKQIKQSNYEKLVIKDKIKKEYCETHNIPLLIIKWNDFKNYKKIFETFFSKIIVNNKKKA